jgi:hypothetical protein
MENATKKTVYIITHNVGIVYSYLLLCVCRQRSRKMGIFGHAKTKCQTYRSARTELARNACDQCPRYEATAQHYSGAASRIGRDGANASFSNGTINALSAICYARQARKSLECRAVGIASTKRFDRTIRASKFVVTKILRSAAYTRIVDQKNVCAKQGGYSKKTDGTLRLGF